MIEELIEWTESLTDQQVRAISHQAGIAGAMTYPVPKLRELCSQNANIVDIFEEYYGR